MQKTLLIGLLLIAITTHTVRFTAAFTALRFLSRRTADSPFRSILAGSQQRRHYRIMSKVSLSKDEVFDLVLEYLSNKGFQETATVLKKESSNSSAPGGSATAKPASKSASRLEDLLEKSYVTELASGEFLPKKITRVDFNGELVPVDETAAPGVPPTTEASINMEDVNIITDGVERKLSMETQIIAYNPCQNDPYGASSMPIYQTATFAQPSATTFGEYDYTRSGNPTRDALQNQIAQLEGVPGAKAFCFTTGMAALTAVTRLVKAGEEVIVNDDSYGGTYRLMSKVATRQGIKIRYIDMSGKGGPANLQAAINPQVKMVMIESPTNPMQRICNIRELAKICHANKHPTGTLLSIDNTMMSPVLSQPLAIGADIVIHSATKFMSGHSDTMAGAVIVREREGEDGKTFAENLYFYQNAEGTALAPFDCWLVSRGIKTMALRVDRQQQNALIIAEWLQSKSNIFTKVYYAGLESHKDYDIHTSQCSGGGSVVCFLTGNTPLSEHIVTNTKLFKITVSFGSVTSLISLPGKMSHASIPADVRSAREFPEDLVRMSIGIESPEDLIADLEQAIASYNMKIATK